MNDQARDPQAEAIKAMQAQWPYLVPGLVQIGIKGHTKAHPAAWAAAMIAAGQRLLCELDLPHVALATLQAATELVREEHPEAQRAHDDALAFLDGMKRMN